MQSSTLNQTKSLDILNLSTLNYAVYLNTMSISDLAWVQYPTALTIWFYITLILCLFGITMNTLLFVITERDRNLWKDSGVQIAHLVAVGTFICPGSMSSDTFMTYFAGPYRKGMSLCPFLHSAKIGSIYIGLWAAAFLAITHLLAISNPAVYRKIRSKLYTLFVILASWVIGSFNVKSGGSCNAVFQSKCYMASLDEVLIVLCLIGCEVFPRHQLNFCVRERWVPTHHPSLRFNSWFKLGY